MEITAFGGRCTNIWITALKSGSIHKLVRNEQIQLDLFDHVNLFEITVPEYPDERLVVCCNPELTKLRKWKRKKLIDATTEKLEAVRATIEGGKLRGENRISKRLENLVKKYKVADHFSFLVRDEGFEVFIDDKNKAEETILNKFFKRNSVRRISGQPRETFRRKRNQRKNRQNHLQI